MTANSYKRKTPGPVLSLYRYAPASFELPWDRVRKEARHFLAKQKAALRQKRQSRGRGHCQTGSREDGS